jgi:hypothetical protein
MKITHKIQIHNGFPPIPSTSLPHSAFSESAHYNFLPLKKTPLLSHSPQKTKQKKIQNHKLSAAQSTTNLHNNTKKRKSNQNKISKQNFNPLEENEGKRKRKPNL